jgi:glycosyltransferase involved in cell wall biosynthesis
VSAPGSRLRLLHVITDLGIGGAEVMLVRLVGRWQAAGHDNLVVSLLPGGELAPRLAATGARVVELGLMRGRLPGPAALKLWRSWREFRPDIVQGWMYHGNTAASLVGLLQLAATPVFWTVHYSLDQAIAPNRLTRWLVRAGAPLSRTVARIVYCSAASAGQHEDLGYDPRRRVVIPNGVDVDRFRSDPAAGARLRALLGVQPDVPLVGTFARYDPMKDHANLLAAVARLRARGRPVHLVLAGSGATAGNGALQDSVAAAGLAGRVSLLGVRDDVDALMPGLNLFVLPSAYGEAFPNVLIEAMAAGVPCVATDLGDCATILGETGLAVPPRDPDRLAAAMERLLAVPETERAWRAEAARGRVLAEFSLPSVAERYLDLYTRTLASGTVPLRVAAGGA